jgi:hypothetical protein
MAPRLFEVLSRVAGTRLVLTAVDPLAVVVAGMLVLPGSVLPVAVAALATLMVCRGNGLHRSRLVPSVIEDLPALLLASLLAVVALVTVSPVLGVTDTAAWDRIAAFGLLVFGGTVLLRTTTYAVSRVLRRTRALAHPVLIVGTGSIGRQLADTLIARREYGLAPVGMLDDGNRHTLRGLPLPLVGGIGDLDRAMTDLEVDDVIFAFAGPPDQDMISTVRLCLEKHRQVFVVPRFHELMDHDRGRRTEMVRDVALMRLSRRSAQAPTRLAQRVVDVVVSLGGLVVLAPVLAVIAVAVRLETGPGVIFLQTRVGEGGRTFTTRKFASLRPAQFGTDATSWDIDNDTRIGPVGRFLRRTGLDELPRLVDVLYGELSLLGPVPAPAPTSGARDTGTGYQHPLLGTVRYDNFSIERRAPWRDVRVRLRSVLTGRHPTATPPLLLTPRDGSRPDAGTPGTEHELTGRRRG